MAMEILGLAHNNSNGELRNRIYHSVILNHLKVDNDYDTSFYELPHIMLSCRQIRSEFMKYGKRTVTCRMLLSIDENIGFLEWRSVTNPSIIKGIATADDGGYSGVITSSIIASRAEAEANLLEWIDEYSDDLPRLKYTRVIMEESWLGDTSGERCCHADLSKDFLARHL